MTVEGIKTIAIIGTGTMGQGIAQVCAQNGLKVLMYDVESEVVTRSIQAIRKSLETLVEKAKISASDKETALSNIQGVSDFRHLQVDLAIEAVVEKLDVKQKIFAELEKNNAKDCLLVSNTSSIPITQIAGTLKYPERFAGLHFFNPAPVMKLIEVIRGSATSDSTVDMLIEFSRRIGKNPVIAQDSPGFIVNRVARQFYVESLKILEENVADFESIDKLMRSTGFKMGPFELMDLIG